MRQAIVTRYHGPTTFKAGRIIATAAAGRRIVEWDHSLPPRLNHRRAAVALCEKFGWDTADLRGGGMPDESGYVFVQPED